MVDVPSNQTSQNHITIPEPQRTLKTKKSLLGREIEISEGNQILLTDSVWIFIFVCTLSVKSIWPPSNISISHPKSFIFNETI